MPDPDAISPAGKVLNYPTNAVDIDLIAAAGTVCRAIRCENAGNLYVITSAGDTVRLPFKAGETQVVQARKLLTANSTAALDITVFW